MSNAKLNTVIVPARKEGFDRVFMGESQWHEIRIGSEMIDRLKYIAAYQVAPISAVTHVALIKEIHYQRTSGKFLITFDGPAVEICPVKVKDPKFAPQSPVYARILSLMSAPYYEKIFVNEASFLENLMKRGDKS